MRKPSAWKSASRVPNCFLSFMCAMVRSRQNWAPPSEQAAILRRPPSSPLLAILKPCPSAPTRFAAGTRHHDIDIGTPPSRNKRLGAVEHVVILLALCAGLQACSIRAGVGLSQAVAAKRLHAAQIGKKASPQLARAVSIDHPRHHIVD